MLSTNGTATDSMMDRGGALAALIATLRTQVSPEQQLAILKQLKNSIVGHDLRKELVVKNGILDELVKVVRLATADGGQDAQYIDQGSDDVRLQCVLILGTLANGGPSFVPAFIAADVPQALIDLLPKTVSARLTTAILQALKSIAASWGALSDVEGVSPNPLPLLPPLSSDSLLNAIFSDYSDSHANGQQVRLVADIIALSAVQESTKSALTETGILDLLADRLAAYAIANGHVDFRGNSAMLPPSPATNSLPSILKAIATIVGGSVYRAHAFLLSPSLRLLFSNANSNGGEHRHLLGPKHGFVAHSEPQLPPLYIPTYSTTTYNGASRAFPALASLQNDGRRAMSGSELMQQRNDPDHLNAVCSYLILLARSLPDRGRLAALRLLALVHNALETDVAGHNQRSESVQKALERSKQLALLAVPLVVQILQVANETKSSGSGLRSEHTETQFVKEEALDVLALLVEQKPELQTAAVEAQAVKHVCPILKKSFDTVPLSRAMWTPLDYSGASLDLNPSCRLGPVGLPAEIAHAMKCRRNALVAIAALAAREDLHRKAIVDAGVVPCIIDSLKPFPADYLEQIRSHQLQASPKDGNTTAVIRGACEAARSMSRSVNALRTSLIDAGLGKPMTPLLTHPDVEVQVAATDVVANLVLEFSVLRDDITSDANTVKTLAAHARSNDQKLSLPSLWALKHLVLSASTEVKLNALEELGAGWLVSAIQGNHRDIAPIPSGLVNLGMSTPNAAGEQVDLLNPTTMEVDQKHHDIAGNEMEDEDGAVMYDESSSTHYQASQLRSTLSPPMPAPGFDTKRYLASLLDFEVNPKIKAIRDEINVQEQALDFVRNLINGDDCATMFEHLMTQIGSAKIFELLTNKLQPVQFAGTRSHPGRQVYNPTVLILGTIHIVLHIANSVSKHKQLLIAQKSLLQAMVPHFTHSDRRVRVICVWFVNSLTWVENEFERPDGRQRARELKIVGIDSAVRSLQNDTDLDVRERVKTAIRQLDSL